MSHCHNSKCRFYLDKTQALVYLDSPQLPYRNLDISADLKRCFSHC